MAIAGPLASFFLAAIAFGLASWGDGGAFPTTVTAVLHCAALLNVVLGTFNLIPAFPLDGGRMLRAALWHFTDSRWEVLAYLETLPRSAAPGLGAPDYQAPGAAAPARPASAGAP